MAPTKKSKMSKRAKKRSVVKDLSAKTPGAVKGGAASDRPTESLSLNYTKIQY